MVSSSPELRKWRAGASLSRRASACRIEVFRVWGLGFRIDSFSVLGPRRCLVFASSVVDPSLAVEKSSGDFPLNPKP